jgi:hypothetical protein
LPFRFAVDRQEQLIRQRKMTEKVFYFPFLYEFKYPEIDNIQYNSVIFLYSFQF